MLPLSTPEGSIDGVVWQNFNVSLRSIEGAIFEKIDQAYTRCFSRLPNSSADPVDNILRGSYGMDVVIRFFEECAWSPKLDSSALHLTELKVGQLTDLVYARSLPKDPATSIKKKRRRSGNNYQRKPTRRVREPASKADKPSSSSDSDFIPKSPSASSQLNETSSESDIGEDKTNEFLKNTEHLKHAKKRLKTAGSVDGTRDTQDNQTHVGPSTQSIECTGKKRGRDPVVREWAFAHHEKPFESFYPNTNKPAWVYKCKYCPSIHDFPRTNKDVSKEKISATNLAGHLKACKKLPAQYQFKGLQSHSNRHTEVFTPAQESLGKMFKSTQPTPGPVGVTPSIFRSTLIQGVVRDNYPLTFGEGKGMKQVFALVSPEVSLPVHSTMRKDLGRLHKVLSMRVQQILSAQNSRFAITSNAWTSKSFVYLLGGVVVTFIDESWNLQEFVLDVVHLDVDHTGAGMGRRIFGSLDQFNAASKVIASVTDNASNNRTMNIELSGRFS
ncbi:hypothetical protein RSOL_422410, partial [Rhizoctonia solani AG-3 Rhs1AP]